MEINKSHQAYGAAFVPSLVNSFFSLSVYVVANCAIYTTIGGESK